MKFMHSSYPPNVVILIRNTSPAKSARALPPKACTISVLRHAPIPHTAPLQSLAIWLFQGAFCRCRTDSGLYRSDRRSDACTHDNAADISPHHYNKDTALRRLISRPCSVYIPSSVTRKLPDALLKDVLTHHAPVDSRLLAVVIQPAAVLGANGEMCTII